MQFQDRILSFFESSYSLPNTPILVHRFPNELIHELDVFTEECIKIKNHSYYFLRNHLNIGMNKFQVSVPSPLLESSFIMAFLIHMGEYYMYKFSNETLDLNRRGVRLRKNDNHFDGYDFWINFINPGDINPSHTHAGSLSGVIYMDNNINLPTQFKNNVSFNGQKGDVIMFPSHLIHSVAENTYSATRITYAFNLDVISHT